MKKPIKLVALSQLKDRIPSHVEIKGLDLVVVCYDNKVSVLYGRCLHRGALMADGHIEGENLICGVHGWDYRYDTGVSEYNNEEVLHKFSSEIKEDAVWIDNSEVKQYLKDHPQPFHREQYLGKYEDTHPENTEPYTAYIKELSQNSLANIGHHGFTEAMGVERDTLPKWHDIQFLPAQLWKRPLLDDAVVNTETIIGPRAGKPLKLAIPLFVSDMSFGALSMEAKIALAKGAELAGTGIASGEGGMLPEEQAANSRYFYELASAKFGFSMENVKLAQAFHFKGGQGAKTGTGGHLPGTKVTEKIAKVRGLQPGEAAISPPAFPDLISAKDFETLAREHLDRSGATGVSLVITGGLRIADDFVKALMLGADAVAISNSALQAIGCLGMRACHTNNCPVGIATQKENLRRRIIIDSSARQLFNFLDATTNLMKVVARACGYDDFSKFNKDDLVTSSHDMYRFTGINFAGLKT